VYVYDCNIKNGKIEFQIVSMPFNANSIIILSLGRIKLKLTDYIITVSGNQCQNGLQKVFLISDKHVKIIKITF
jgi:hypothetical protein